jgi:tetratricopeptide (TPR) repeat protein
MILEQHGMCLLVQGEYANAAEWLRQAFEICKREEVHTMYVPIASHLGLAMLGLGALDEARQLIESAAREPLDRAGHYAIDYLRIAQSELQRRLGQLEQACATAELAVNDTQRCGERGFHVRALVQLARVLTDMPGQRDRALATCIEAETSATQLGMPPWAALARQGAGRLYAAGGDKVEAAQAYAVASAIWHRLEVPARILEVARLSDELARLRVSG